MTTDSHQFITKRRFIVILVDVKFLVDGVIVLKGSSQLHKMQVEVRFHFRDCGVNNLVIACDESN